MSPGGAPRAAAPAAAPAARPLAMPRDRRLKRRRLIRPLFAGAAGRVSAGSVQLRWAVAPRAATGTDSPLQVGFAPGRRTTKVARNRVRRVMRETWRIHQAPLLDAFAGRPASTLTVFALFRGREETAADDIRRDLPAAMTSLLAAVA